MSSVSALNVGPVVTRPYNLAVSRSSPSGVRGFREVTFSGDVDQELADVLDELVVNPALRQTIGGRTGAMAYVVAASPLIRNVSGYHLLLSFESTLSVDPLWPYAAFTLTAVLVGDLP